MHIWIHSRIQRRVDFLEKIGLKYVLYRKQTCNQLICPSNLEINKYFNINKQMHMNLKCTKLVKQNNRSLKKKLFCKEYIMYGSPINFFIYKILIKKRRNQLNSIFLYLSKNSFHISKSAFDKVLISVLWLYLQQRIMIEKFLIEISPMYYNIKPLIKRFNEVSVIPLMKISVFLSFVVC